ncbi:hypothetical protein [Ornithinimicrobium kibberense]|uniref:hypothetical protein n=1 Tax=Ornithinimicrobium kibberense TaxID=282060 RepID=UPI00361C4581
MDAQLAGAGAEDQPLRLALRHVVANVRQLQHVAEEGPGGDRGVGVDQGVQRGDHDSTVAPDGSGR